MPGCVTERAMPTRVSYTQIRTRPSRYMGADQDFIAVTGLYLCLRRYLLHGYAPCFQVTESALRGAITREVATSAADDAADYAG